VDHHRRPRLAVGVVRVRFILEAARRRWIVDFQREDKTRGHPADLRAPENGTETARTPPTTPDPSDKGTL
jgi:hypothetical protein